ncbi:DMT family transporter [Candidatus Woesearchaeota archaeon]|nr:DMT family transporter [Candidatus Woesearchaeota archaeon]
MLWIFFSVLAALTFAIVNVIDKYTLTKWIRKPTLPVTIFGFVGLVAAVLVYAFHGYAPLSPINVLLGFLSGAASVLATIFYLKAAKIEEISRVTALLYLAPLFTVFLARIFLDESFTAKTYVGVVLLVVGAVLASSKSLKHISLGGAFWIMMLSNFAFAVNGVIAKYLLNFADFWTVFSYIRVGAVFALIPFAYFKFNELKMTVKENGKKVVALITFNQSLNVFGNLFINIATAFGFVTLVSALGAVQPFFVLIFAVGVSIFISKKALEEEINKSSLLLKLSAIILIVIGAISIT